MTHQSNADFKRNAASFNDRQARNDKSIVLKQKTHSSGFTIIEQSTAELRASNRQFLRAIFRYHIEHDCLPPNHDLATFADRCTQLSLPLPACIEGLVI